MDRVAIGMIAVIILVVFGVITTVLVANEGIRQRGIAYVEKQEALTQFELQCEKARKPYCQEVIVVMQKELNVQYPKV